jgi:hypothetical protein
MWPDRIPDTYVLTTGSKAVCSKNPVTGISIKVEDLSNALSGPFRLISRTGFVKLASIGFPEFSIFQGSILGRNLLQIKTKPSLIVCKISMSFFSFNRLLPPGSIRLASISCLVLISTSLKAEDSNLPKSSGEILEVFGLQDVKPIRKTVVSTVRGSGGIAQTTGFSFVSGILIDPETTSNIFGLDANSALSSLTLDDPIRPADPVHQHQSQLELELTVDSFFSNLIGGSGGAAAAFFR